MRHGWFGNPQGHALAARGIRMYAKKESMSPVFFAQRREEQVPFSILVDMVKDGRSYQDMCREYPVAEKEDVRLRGIKAVETVHGDNTLSLLNRNGIDDSVSMSRSDPNMRNRMLLTIDDRQKSSFMQPVKVEALRSRLRSG